MIKTYEKKEIPKIEQFKPINNQIHSSIDDFFIPFRDKDRSVNTWRLRIANCYQGSFINKKKRRELENKRGFVRFYREEKKINNKRSLNYLKEIEEFYQKAAFLNENTIKNIATDADKELRFVVKGVKNNKWFFSKMHAVNDVAVCHNLKNKFLKGRIKKEKAGYYQFLKGNTKKMIDFFKKQEQTTLIKKFLSKASSCKEGIENRKTAQFGYNAESEVSKIKMLLHSGRSVYTAFAFANILRAHGYYVIL